MRPNVNTQTALTLPGPIPLQKGVGPGNEASEGGAHVKCLSGLEFLVRKTVKYCKGVQHNYRLANNTKKN